MGKGERKKRRGAGRRETVRPASRFVIHMALFPFEIKKSSKRRKKERVMWQRSDLLCFGFWLIQFAGSD